MVLANSHLLLVTNGADCWCSGSHLLLVTGAVIGGALEFTSVVSN